MTDPGRIDLGNYLESRADILGGEPVIKGTRITCRSVLGRIEDGDTIDDLCAEYDSIPRAAFEAAIRYARTHPQGSGFRFGILKGAVVPPPGEFFAALTEEELAGWEGDDRSTWDLPAALTVKPDDER